ncbi:ribosome maturation factor RimP [Paraglaciecola mesophila]|uniref:Ribosome maturation factor RimP n=2 Tax=Paraglaciecola mesophila TaxID=197222 RepID=K6XZI6_9ALTE|nr:ribosome maturation factor RimP [Paraglaciecola mesophila]GAC26019.1 ribosome maturation factor RimP [Paraglaciecola mesophila KMM 241]
MSQLEQKLTEMLTAPVEALGFEMVGIEFVRAGKHSTMRVYIDHPDGISVDHCAEVSHQVSAVLDVEDPINTEYNLEVSSPGMERPLFKLQHYIESVGEIVTLRLKMPMGDRRNFKGKLLSEADGMLTIEVDNQEFVLAFANIEKGNVVPTFD